MKIVKRDITFLELANQSFCQRLFFCSINQKYKDIVFLSATVMFLPILITMHAIDAMELRKVGEFDDKISFENVYALEFGK